jgi:predicted dehydrogenase
LQAVSRFAGFEFPVSGFLFSILLFPSEHSLMTVPLRVGVVGVGYLGAFHADKYATLPDVELVAVVDADHARADTVAARCHTRAATDYRSLFDDVDCVSLAVPTPLHFALALDFLLHDIDVLVEKPMTETVTDGRTLVDTAEQRGRILQVGHLERFNPAIRALAGIITQPRFIECHRLAPFVERGTDVDVILDLMIHDLDVILSLVQADVQSVEAVGVPVLSENTDIANARLRFTNGCIANITASRVALKRERKIRLFQADTYVSVDYGEKHVRVCRRHPGDAAGTAGPTISVEEHALGDSDALFDEIEHFVHAVRTREPPLVDGRTALRALEVAERIRGSLESA